MWGLWLSYCSILCTVGNLQVCHVFMDVPAGWVFQRNGNGLHRLRLRQLVLWHQYHHYSLGCISALPGKGHGPGRNPTNTKPWWTTGGFLLSLVAFIRSLAAGWFQDIWGKPSRGDYPHDLMGFPVDRVWVKHESCFSVNLHTQQSRKWRWQRKNTKREAEDCLWRPEREVGVDVW